MDIYEAAKTGNLTRIRELIQSGANVNIKNNSGNTPIHIASRSGNIDIIRALITAGAGLSVNIKNNDGETPLIFACYNGNIEIVNALIMAGADVNISEYIGKWENDGMTPLIIASQNNNIEIVKALIKAGADVNIRDNIDRTAYDVASNNDIRDLLRLTKMIINKEKVKAFRDGWEKITDQSGIHGPPRQILQNEGLVPKGAYFYGGYYNKLQKYINKLK